MSVNILTHENKLDLYCNSITAATGTNAEPIYLGGSKDSRIQFIRDPIANSHQEGGQGVTGGLLIAGVNNNGQCTIHIDGANAPIILSNVTGTYNSYYVSGTYVDYPELASFRSRVDGNDTTYMNFPFMGRYLTLGTSGTALTAYQMVGVGDWGSNNEGFYMNLYCPEPTNTSFNLTNVWNGDFAQVPGPNPAYLQFYSIQFSYIAV